MKSTFLACCTTISIAVITLTLAAECQSNLLDNAPSSTVTFASNTGTRVFDSYTVFLGQAEQVCLNTTSPIVCPPGAVVYGYTGSGWLADLTQIPGGEATWVYAPGILGTTSPAGLAEYFFETDFVIAGIPTGGKLFIAADDFAQIIVNGASVGFIGSLTNVTKAENAANFVHKLDIGTFLVNGKNHIRIRQRNGPASLGNCPKPDNYACNPSGVVYGGFATY